MTAQQAAERQAGHETVMHELMLAVGKYLNALDTWDGSRKAERHTERCEAEMRSAYAKAQGEQK